MLLPYRLFLRQRVIGVDKSSGLLPCRPLSCQSVTSACTPTDTWREQGIHTNAMSAVQKQEKDIPVSVFTGL